MGRRLVSNAAAVACAAVLSVPLAATAEIKTETVEYKQGEATLEGYVAYDDAVTGKRPGIIVAHEWGGLTGYERMRAEMLAKLGFVALAADIYGKGVRPTAVSDKMGQSGKYSKDRVLLRARMQAALETLRRNAQVEAGRIAAIGFCFGGTAALELARSGADVAGVVSFHGGLSNPSPQDDRNVKARVLVLHGAADPLVPKPAVDTLIQQLTEAKVDWQGVLYSGTMHSFTNPASNDPAHGIQYNETSATRAWTAMQDFLREVLGR
jgi:dienelactone hydrolase